MQKVRFISVPPVCSFLVPRDMEQIWLGLVVSAHNGIQTIGKSPLSDGVKGVVVPVANALLALARRDRALAKHCRETLRQVNVKFLLIDPEDCEPAKSHPRPLRSSLPS